MKESEQVGRASGPLRPREGPGPIWVEVSNKANEVRCHVTSAVNIGQIRCVELADEEHQCYEIAARVSRKLTDPNTGTDFKCLLTA